MEDFDASWEFCAPHYCNLPETLTHGDSFELEDDGFFDEFHPSHFPTPHCLRVQRCCKPLYAYTPSPTRKKIFISPVNKTKSRSLGTALRVVPYQDDDENSIVKTTPSVRKHTHTTDKIQKTKKRAIEVPTDKENIPKTRSKYQNDEVVSLRVGNDGQTHISVRKALARTVQSRIQCN